MKNYFIIEKLEVINDELVYTPVGYVSSQEDANHIHEDEKMTEFQEWESNNKEQLVSKSISITDFFNSVEYDYIYVNGTIKSYIPKGIQEITNLNNLGEI